MKAIILAAGVWSRLNPLTNTRPKPLIKIFWKPIIEYNIENIYKYVSEIIIIIKYKWELIKQYFSDNYKWVKISYKIQNNKKWTAAAIMWLESDSDVLIMNSDSIFNKQDIKNICEFSWYWALVKKVDNPEIYWIFSIDVDGNILNIEEKPKKYVWNLANLWLYKFNSKILEIVNSIDISSRWEYEITDAINIYSKKYPFKVFEINWYFLDITYPQDILKINWYFLDNLLESKILWQIEDSVIIKWNIFLEKWAILKSWTYIEWNCYIWKNTIIWPNTYLRWATVIWDNCKIWNAVEIKNCSIWDNTHIAHLSYFWDSILWNNINIWWWFISANLRHNKENIKLKIKWKLIDTWLHKLWIIIWDNCKTWINTSSMPWRILENNNFTNPWTIIK